VIAARHICCDMSADRTIFRARFRTVLGVTVPGSLSPDGWWLWGGAAWIPSVSPDGAWRWNGRTWVAVHWPRSRWPTLLVVLAIVAAVGFGGLVAIDAWLMHVGCGSIDPTDPNNYSVVSILNDTRDPVVVYDCRGAYCDAGTVTLPPDMGTRVQAACNATGSDMTSWRLATVSGSTIGYVAVDTPRKHDGLVFLVSRATHNRALASLPQGVGPTTSPTK
jgi:hypothetical protein